jgi:hypothetical protein
MTKLARELIGGARMDSAASPMASSFYASLSRSGTVATRILKERAFGLTGNQGNRGEDVKEYYFYLDVTPSHSYLHYLYKYPQAEYPYASLTEENRKRNRTDPPFNPLDTEVFAGGRYWDIEAAYAKASPDEIHIRITAAPAGPVGGGLLTSPSATVG